MKKLLILALFITNWALAQDLQQGFQNPPNQAKPRVWWHWMNGNISKEGIQKDLDWMERVGVGGVHNFDANLFTPVVVPKKIVFMTPEWKDAFKFTTELADKKGFELTIAGSPGWSVTGGPWVSEKDGMKKYVWTETKLAGGTTFSGKLAKPSEVTGKFQAVANEESILFGGSEKPKKQEYYNDAAVVAYRLPAVEQSFLDLKPKLSSSGGKPSLEQLTDGNLVKTTTIPPLEIGQDMWVQYEFETPQKFQSYTLAGGSKDPLAEFNGLPLNRSLKVSDDGINFREISKPSGSTNPISTFSFTPTTAKFWRICFKTLSPSISPIIAMMGGKQPKKPDGVEIAEFNLLINSRIDQFEDKAGFTPWTEDGSIAANEVGVEAIDEVIDLTKQMQADGTLNWTAPASIDGKPTSWVIVRLGYSLTGRKNHPASPEATGLEVDKLDKDAVKRYINTYLDMYKDATGGLMGAKGLQFMVLDSYEAGHMNWTHTLMDDFKRKRSYDLKQWIPVLTGRIVKSRGESEQFLWDFRKTIGELIAENHYDVIGEELNKRGMKRYTESHENKRIYLADGMDVKRNAEIPMAAMWTPGSLAGGSDEEPRSEGDIRESASVANIYGKSIVAAESMTSVGKSFTEHPGVLKRTADLEMASGLNRFVIHTSVHQPLDDKKPGFSLGPFGQYFTRQETWAEDGGKAWMQYLGRSCHLLQQGKNVADVLYLYGENTNITWVCKDKLPTIPAGFEFDFVNSTALLDAIDAKNGQLVAKSGNAYSILMLDESTRFMTLPVLRKIKLLVDAGIKIIGKQPEKSPSLSDNNTEFQTLAAQIWRNSNVISTEKISIKPDVLVSATTNKILFRHRKITETDTDIYWLNNRSEKSTEAEVSFRITGKKPELWNAVTGKIEDVSYKIQDGRTIVLVPFEAWDAFFVVFSKPTKVLSLNKPKATEQIAGSISMPWTVSFGNKTITTNSLTSWHTNTDSEVKYFSGTAVYKNTFKLTKKGVILIDLGNVQNLATLTINGQKVGTAWKAPFKLDVSQFVKVGENTIQIEVTNTWANRLIGDAQPDVKAKTTFVTMPFYKADGTLLPAGLLSEVKILKVGK